MTNGAWLGLWVGLECKNLFLCVLHRQVQLRGTQLTQADVDEAGGTAYDEERSDARSSSEELDDEDGDDVADDLDGAWDEEVEVVVGPEVGAAVGQAVVHHRIHHPEEDGHISK